MTQCQLVQVETTDRDDLYAYLEKLGIDPEVSSMASVGLRQSNNSC
jgi:hypothetical protein